MKIYFTILAILGAMFGSIWAFNHIDAWIGIFCFLAIVGVIGYYLIKQSKQKQQ